MKKKNVVKREIKSKRAHERNIVRFKVNIPVAPRVEIEEVVEEIIPEPVVKKPVKKNKQHNEKKPVETVIEQPLEETPEIIENNEQNIE